MHMGTYDTVITMPAAHVMAATASLTRDLRRHLLADELRALPDWSTLTVTGPVEMFDARGHLVFEYRATVRCHSLA